MCSSKVFILQQRQNYDKVQRIFTRNYLLLNIYHEERLAELQLWSVDTGGQTH